MPNQKRPLVITVDIIDLPADLPSGLGWIGATMTAIRGRVTGEIITAVDSTGLMTREALITIEDHAGAGLARVVSDDPVVLRILSASPGVWPLHLCLCGMGLLAVKLLLRVMAPLALTAAAESTADALRTMTCVLSAAGRGEIGW